MSRINRKQLRNMLLKEFRMMGIAPMGGGMMGSSPFPSPQPDLEYDHPEHGHRRVDDIGSLDGDSAFGVGFEAGASGVLGHSHGGHKGSLTMEDCCKAVLCLIECCDCEITKQKIADCCHGILASC